MSRGVLGLLPSSLLPLSWRKAELNKQSTLFFRISKFTIISSQGSLKSKGDLSPFPPLANESISRHIIPHHSPFPPALSLIRSEKEQAELVMIVKGLKSWALLSCPFITCSQLSSSHPALTLIWTTCPAPLALSVLMYNRLSLITLHLHYSDVAGSITDCDEPFNRPWICLVKLIVAPNRLKQECEMYRNRYKWSPYRGKQLVLSYITAIECNFKLASLRFKDLHNKYITSPVRESR